MTIRIAISVLLSAALAAAAQAQSFEGAYRGSRKTTRIAPHVPNTRLECTPVGQPRPLEFRVVGSSITMRYLDFAHQVTGTVAADGTFALAGSYAQHGGPTAGRVHGRWTGRIEGPRLTGRLHAWAPGGECFGDFSARK